MMSHFTTIPTESSTKTPSYHYHLSLHHFLSLYTSLINTLYNLPTSFLALLLTLLITYNTFSIFSLHVTFSPELPVIERPLGHDNIKTSKLPPPPPASLSMSSVLYAVKEESFPRISKTHLRNLQEEEKSIIPIRSFPLLRRKKMKRSKNLKKVWKFRPLMDAESKGFAKKVNDFFRNGSRSCEVKFFMTWMASLDGFGDRERIGIQSLFCSHPNACLVIVSSTMESNKGDEILRPFWDKGYRVMSISPSYGFLFRNTPAELWFEKLRKGNLNPGEVSLGQNLSNLLRLVLLYKFGGVYLDTDVMVLKNMSRLRNVIGAQTIDVETRNWTRLNNAVLVFDKNHPLLFKFIQEFAVTFDGNKWGHNGPYLVSRVVSRLAGRPGYNFTVLDPSAFYPVDWTRISSIFHGPRGESHSKWMRNKLNFIRRESIVVHLWNKHSRNMEIEKGSIVDRIISDCCIFCNGTLSNLSIRNKIKG